MSLRRAQPPPVSRPLARRWIAIALFAPLALASCGSSGGGPVVDGAVADADLGVSDGPLDVPDVPASAEDAPVDSAGPTIGAAFDGAVGTDWVGPACAAGAARFCQKLVECAPLFLWRAWSDLASCTERMRLDCVHDALSRDSSLTSQTVAACTSALDVTSCSDFFARKIDSCWSKGERPDGDRCGSNKQCKSGYCALQGECGYCTASGGAGALCGAVESCQMGLICTAGVCVLPGHLDQPCSTQSPCDLALYCQDGRCRPAGKEGEECVGASSCDLWQALFCNPSTGKCQRFFAAGPGQPCGVVPGGVAYCVPGGDCSGVNALGTGTCVGLVGEGESCVMRRCNYPARCGDGICRLPDAARCP